MVLLGRTLGSLLAPSVASGDQKSLKTQFFLNVFCSILYSLGGPLEALWGHFGSFWGHFGVILGSSWGHYGVTLGSLWDDFGVNFQASGKSGAINYFETRPNNKTSLKADREVGGRKRSHLNSQSRNS